MDTKYNEWERKRTREDDDVENIVEKQHRTEKPDPLKRLKQAEEEFFEVNKGSITTVAASHKGNLKTLVFKGLHGIYPSPRTKGWCVVTTLVKEDGQEIPQYHVVMDVSAASGGLDAEFPKRWGKFPVYWMAVGWEEKPFLSNTGQIMCHNFSAHVLLIPSSPVEDDWAPIFTPGLVLGAQLPYSIPAWVVEVISIESCTTDAGYGDGGEQLKGRIVKFKYDGEERELKQYRTKTYDTKDSAVIRGNKVLMLGVKRIGNNIVNGSCCQLIPENKFVEIGASRELWEKLQNASKVQIPTTKKTASTF